MRIGLGHMNQMLATTKPDLEPDLALAKIALDINRIAVGVFIPSDRTTGQPVQIILKIIVLRRTDRFATKASIKITPRRTGGVFCISHGRPCSKAMSAKQRQRKMGFNPSALNSRF